MIKSLPQSVEKYLKSYKNLLYFGSRSQLVRIAGRDRQVPQITARRTIVVRAPRIETHLLTITRILTATPH